MRSSDRLVLALVCLGAAGAFGGCVSGDDSTGQPDATTDATGSDVTTLQDVAAQDVNNGDGATGCAARTASDAAGIFVAPSGTDTSSCGTRANPCQTISYSIATAKAASGKTTLYLSKATYAESITLDAPLTLEGGWSDTGGTWTPVCDATTSTAVTIQGVTNTTVTVGFSGAGTLRDLQVTSKAQAAASESLYGVFATGSATNLTLDGVVVNIGEGGVGTNGTMGTDATPTSDAGCATAGNATAGGAGSVGTGAAAGSLTSTGFVTVSGGDGGLGGAGGNGSLGGSGACATNCATACSINQCNLAQKSLCAGEGLAGCGGAGGGGGSFGTGGGSSIAVFVWDAHVTVFGGSFASANGGNGGAGGGGGAQGTAGVAEPGSSVGCVTNASCVGNACNYIAGFVLDGGAPGTTGAHGGVGGQGGGGSGGDSYAIVSGGDGGVTLNNSPTLAHGDAGAGGVANGANGVAADRVP